MFDFQKRCLQSYFDGRHGILNAPTGTGKTFALAIPFLIEALKQSKKSKGLQVLWVTPLKALSVDISNAIAEASEELKVGWRVERRTGDVSHQRRKRRFKIRLSV